MYSIEIMLNDDLTAYEATVRDYNDRCVLVCKHKRPAVLMEQVNREILTHLKACK